MGEIVSSTGDLGLEERGDNRLYMNWGGEPISQASTIEGFFRRTARTRPDTFEGRRDVFRGLVEEGVVYDLVKSENFGDAHIEAAFPIKDGLWYIGMARNHATRLPLRDVNIMSRDVRENVRPFISPVDTIRSVLVDEQYSFISTITPDNINTQTQLLNLWAETFGWNEEKITNFTELLNVQDKNFPSVWFSGLVDKDGKLVAAAMAELITFKGLSGEKVKVVESSEWRSRKLGHIKAVVDQLHAQVINSYPDSIIIAECNYHRGAHRAAQKSGMISPDVIVDDVRIPQVLAQNVVVGDGLDPLGGLRDFVLFVLPNNAISRDEARDILEMTM